MSDVVNFYFTKVNEETGEKTELSIPSTMKIKTEVFTPFGLEDLPEGVYDVTFVEPLDLDLEETLDVNSDDLHMDDELIYGFLSFLEKYKDGYRYQGVSEKE